MNKIKSIAIIALLMSVCVSCDSYLDIPLDNQMTKEEVFSKRSSTEQYLAQVYGFLPDESALHGGPGSVVPRSDEALFSWYSGIGYLPFMNGTWGPTTGDYSIWTNSYKGINQATIFMDNVDACKEISQANRDIMKAEARFIRAYLYFCLVRQYGPVFVWGDQAPDLLFKADNVDRHSLDANVDFIVSEYDKAIAVLPLKITDELWYGRMSKGAAMAAKSRLLLYAASPLYNGADIYKGLKNKDGEFLFPQSNDPQKWEKAARAAKDVIDLGIYKLYENKTESNPLRKAIKSYQGGIFDKWNDELIWGKWTSGFDIIVRCSPPRVVREGYGGYAASIKLVDTYPMAKSGRYPITGYKADGTPIIDPKSGYVGDGFTNPYIHPLDTVIPINAHNSCIGRDARFYASILANGFNWINTYKGTKLVTYYTGGTSTFTSSGDCVKSGFLWRKFSDPTLNIEEGNWGQIIWPLYKISEMYLNYAEACNEKPTRDEAEALRYVNMTRRRADLNDLEVAYPEVKGNKELLRTLIQKERMVELAFEGHRYYDACRWMIAVKEFTGSNFTLNLMANNYEESWKRTDRVWQTPRLFQPKHYFFPINQAQLNEMKNITQNYGW